MKTRQNKVNGKLKMMFGMLTLVLIGLASAQQAQAQLPPTPPVTLNYNFNVPVAKILPNPCSAGFVLVSGNMGVNVATTQDSAGFRFTLGVNSTGTGKDVMANGTLLLTSTDYSYSSTMNADANFPNKPAYFSIEVPNGDALYRQYVDASDSFVLETTFALVFANGVPSVPTISGLNVRCNSKD